VQTKTAVGKELVIGNRLVLLIRLLGFSARTLWYTVVRYAKEIVITTTKNLPPQTSLTPLRKNTSSGISGHTHRSIGKVWAPMQIRRLGKATEQVRTPRHGSPSIRKTTNKPSYPGLKS